MSDLSSPCPKCQAMLQRVADGQAIRPDASDERTFCDAHDDLEQAAAHPFHIQEHWIFLYRCRACRYWWEYEQQYTWNECSIRLRRVRSVESWLRRQRHKTSATMTAVRVLVSCALLMLIFCGTMWLSIRLLAPVLQGLTVALVSVGILLWQVWPDWRGRRPHPPRIF
jgi:hypothetical protein